MALRHHDEAAKTRAVERFSDNLRVVARRDGVAARESRLVAASPARTARPPTPRDQPVETSLLHAHRSAAAAAARRRRKVLAVLLAALVIVGAGSYLGYLQVWAPGVPAAVTVVFLALARVLARRESACWHSLVTARRNAARTAASGSDPSPLIEPSSPEVEPARNVENAPPTVAAARVELPESAFPSGLEDNSSIPVALVAKGPRSELWDPLPVTLPTYVTKPRATRSVRTIDLRDTDVVSSGRNADDSALVAEAEAASSDAEQDERRAFGS